MSYFLHYGRLYECPDSQLEEIVRLVATNRSFNLADMPLVRAVADKIINITSMTPERARRELCSLDTSRR